jgi:type III restriction enzyme
MSTAYATLGGATVLPQIETAKKVLRKGNPTAFQVPTSVIDNLKHTLRAYQQSALENYIFAQGDDGLELGVHPQHHLVHAATGAGKTAITAGAILYLYSLGYRKFIFLTNQVNLINKTRLNLLPGLGSKKLEFAKDVRIDGQKVFIREAIDRFSTVEGVGIEILFTTIQSIHALLQEGKENKSTLASLTKNKVAIIADEAHHFNTATGTQQKEECSWETSIKALVSAHPGNKLIELTATMDLGNASILAKYRDKLVFDYPLRSFRAEGYSKEISLVQLASATETDRATVAILVSQYRQDLAQENGIPLIPRVLVKCAGTIHDLAGKEHAVLTAVKALSPEVVMGLVMDFALVLPGMNAIGELYANDSVALAKFVNRVKMNYCKGNSRVIHSKNSPIDKANKMDELNSIDSSPAIRLVFAINILNEGWDVLSLFDIVKFDEVSTAKKSTTAEAQLIGRGARIFPYAWSVNGEARDPFKRKFDQAHSNPLRLLEEMYFYSASDNAYITALHQGLVDAGLKEKDEPSKTNVASQVGKSKALSDFAQRMSESGFVVSNKSVLEHTTFTALTQFKLAHNSVHSAMAGVVTLGAEAGLTSTTRDVLTLEDLVTRYPAVVNKGLRRVPGWSLNKVNVLLTKVTTSVELLAELGGLQATVSVTVEGCLFDELLYARKLAIVTEVLIDLAKQLASKKTKKAGVKAFVEVSAIKQVFLGYTKDSTKIFVYGKSPIRGTNAVGNEFSPKPFAIKQDALFYYDHFSWDSELELEMYKLFDEYLDPTIYLVIRNEVGFKLYGTEGDSNGEGFEPDFIVLRDVGERGVIQYFVEVKGANLAKNVANAWKQKLLLSLKGDQAIDCNGCAYHLVGLPFFTEGNSPPGEARAYSALLAGGESTDSKK